MIIEKQYARRSIAGFRSPYEDPFQYTSITHIDSYAEIVAVVQQLQDESLGRDMHDEDAKTKFEGMIEFAGSAYSPESWMIVRDGDRTVGAVFAQRYWDKLEEGSLFVVGLTPEYRGKGYGKILHAKGLELLAAQGVEEYVGSTDIHNIPMIRVFEANGCRLTAVRKIELGNGIVE